MKLEKYHQKRKFEHTPEPKGKIGKASSHLFVVQKHASKHLHYDFRLEIDGVLKSWAVPKGPSLDPTIKRLAVQVEDHPIEYGDFEGVIPKGQYGAGTVMVWDKGKWYKDEEDTQKKKGAGFTFFLEGTKLQGKWKLIEFKDDPKNWLLIKAPDDKACSETDYSITREEPLSALSGRALDEIANAQDSTWCETACASMQKKKTPKIILPKLDNLVLKKTNLPNSIDPQLATLVSEPPSGAQWLHEIKFDGYRLLCVIDKDVKLITRGQKEWSDKFADIVKAVKKLNLAGTILDGEIVALDENNRSNFQLLQNALHKKENSQLAYYIFDLIYFQNYNLSQLELLERKEILQKILPPSQEGLIRFSDHIVGNGQSVFENACALNLEGIISKNIHSHYMQKRTKSWLKVKCHHRQEFVVGGFTQPHGNRSYFGSLLLGYYLGDHFQYCGHVGTGFTDHALNMLYELLIKYKTEKSPFDKAISEKNLLSWVKPKVVVEVEFTEWTKEGILRHPSFKGIREDKFAKTIGKEKLMQFKPDALSGEQNKLSSVLSSPEKILYPEEAITKRTVAEFYQTIQDWILPYIVKRPLTLVRCPRGITEKCFFQRHLQESDKQSSGLYSVEVPGKIDKEYLYLKDIKGLLALVQKGVLEIHTWGARIDKLDKPDMIIFDLDPGEGVLWETLIKAAFQIRAELESLGLETFVKTTGGKGLHIVIPIARRYIWDDVLIFSKTFANYLAKKYPSSYTAVMSKLKRHNKIFIDYVRNHQGATAVAPYSTRARPHATIATPLSWTELTPKITPAYYTLATVVKRLEHLQVDPWQRFGTLKQRLP